jgi:hypothetical protein
MVELTKGKLRTVGNKQNYMTNMEHLKSFIRGTEANKNSRVQEGLFWASKYRYKNPKACKEWESKIIECQRGPRSACPYTVMELRGIADRISPGLGNTATMWSACSAVTDK